MAVTTCHKCSGHAFELAPLLPLGDSRKLTLVQCASCGTPIGALDSDLGVQIETLLREVRSPRRTQSDGPCCARITINRWTDDD